MDGWMDRWRVWPMMCCHSIFDVYFGFSNRKRSSKSPKSGVNCEYYSEIETFIVRVCQLTRISLSHNRIHTTSLSKLIHLYAYWKQCVWQTEKLPAQIVIQKSLWNSYARTRFAWHGWLNRVLRIVISILFLFRLFHAQFITSSSMLRSFGIDVCEYMHLAINNLYVNRRHFMLLLLLLLLLQQKFNATTFEMCMKCGLLTLQTLL